MCVCVCTPLIAKSFGLRSSAGECGMTVGPHSTKLPQSWDTESDQLGVPASVSASAFASEVARGQAENPIRT